MEEIQIDAETGVQQPEAAGPTSGTGLEQEDPHHLNPNPNLNAGLSILVSSLYPQVLEIYRLLYASSTTSSSSDGDPNNNKADIDGAAMDAGESGMGKKEVEVKDPTVRPDVKGAEVAKLANSLRQTLQKVQQEVSPEILPGGDLSIEEQDDLLRTLEEELAKRECS